jgi:hypothetical protein
MCWRNNLHKATACAPVCAYFFIFLKWGEMRRADMQGLYSLRRKARMVILREGSDGIPRWGRSRFYSYPICRSRVGGEDIDHGRCDDVSLFVPLGLAVQNCGEMRLKLEADWLTDWLIELINPGGGSKGIKLENLKMTHSFGWHEPFYIAESRSNGARGRNAGARLCQLVRRQGRYNSAEWRYSSCAAAAWIHRARMSCPFSVRLSFITSFDIVLYRDKLKLSSPIGCHVNARGCSFSL